MRQNSNLIERTGETALAIVIVAREDLIINRAVRNVVGRGVPVIYITTDLPTSGRTTYIGNDQVSAGATAAYLMGQAVGNREGNILFVYSAPYRVQEDRELGFRRFLRSEYSLLKVDERVNSNDETELVYPNVVRYIEEHGPRPAFTMLPQAMWASAKRSMNLVLPAKQSSSAMNSMPIPACYLRPVL